MKKSYPGGRTLAQWRGLSYDERQAWATQEKCDALRLWAACTKRRRCRRHRTCRGDQFDCLSRHRETSPAAARVRDDAICAAIDARLAIGTQGAA